MSFDESTNFADFPKAFNEYRAERIGTAQAMTPRQMLISLLRDIDSGDLKIESLALCGIAARRQATRDSPMIHSIYLRFGGTGSQFEFSGLLERSQQLLWETRIVGSK